MNTFLNDLAGIIGIADVIDVLLLGVFLYAVISWLRQSTSTSAPRRVVVVIVPFLAVYLLAYTFDLVLVEWLLRALLLVLLLALVVVFQSDLRRLVDRIGSWGFGRGRRAPAALRTVDILAEASSKLAETHTGALIAIRGAEPWNSHVLGGIDLDGLLTRPLLYSIFAPDTPGHDGAVLLEGERVTKFAAHLPLSARPSGVNDDGGTRHAAAVGLSEECDALVIVISEERGTISLAENGELSVMSSAGALRARLDRFWLQHYAGDPAIREKWWGRRSFENGLLALSLSVMGWFLFAYSADTVQRTFQVPIAFRNLPAEWVIEGDTIEARVVLSGSEQAFRLLDSQNLVASFDLSDPQPGQNELIITEDNLNLPSGVSLTDVNPREFTIGARRQEELELPIQLRTVGVLPDSLTLISDPQTVTVLVPAGSAYPPEHVLTEPIDLQGGLEGAVRSTLVLPPGIRLPPDESAEVTVRVERRGTEGTR